MNKTKKFILASALIGAALLILVLGMLSYYREQTFPEILPVNPDTAVVRIETNDMHRALDLPETLFRDFLADMSAFQYRHVTDASGMDSFGRMTFTADGKHIEIMFSTPFRPH